MKRTFILGAMIGISMAAYAFEPLDSVYTQLAANKNAVATEVKYSGSFSDDCSGFIFQRGDGNGWTKGTRFSVSNVTLEEAQRIQNVFDKNEIQLGWVVKKDSQRACFDEKQMTVYAFDYDSDAKTLYLLRADVEDEICIPYDWTQRNYHYAPAAPISINWTEALARLYTEMKYNSAFYDKVASKVDSVYHTILDQLPDADNYESYRLLQKLAATCGDGHTFIYVSHGLLDMPTASPFTTVLLGDRLFVNTVECEELEKAGMKRGMEIMSVNDMAPRDYASQQLLPYISTSTPQWADHEMFDGYGFSNGRKGSPLNLTLTEDGGKNVITIKHNIGEAKYQHDKAIHKKRSFHITKDNIGILTLPDFATSAVTDYFDYVYPDILETDALVIDLRRNGGGNSNYADYILRHLTTDSISTQPWRTPVYMPAFASWGKKPQTYESPSEKMAPAEGVAPYLKPVAVVTDRGTFSAAEDFCSLFKGMKRGPIVGTPTGGSTGNGVRALLTKGIYANICSKHDFMPDGTEFVGIGIIPDVVIEETPESYFSNSTDIVLEKAISTLLPTK